MTRILSQIILLAMVPFAVGCEQVIQPRYENYDSAGNMTHYTDVANDRRQWFLPWRTRTCMQFVERHKKVKEIVDMECKSVKFEGSGHMIKISVLQW